MGKGITYTAKTPDADGLIQYTDADLRTVRQRPGCSDVVVARWPRCPS